jgi:hypothetical protein
VLVDGDGKPEHAADEPETQPAVNGEQRGEHDTV